MTNQKLKRIIPAIFRQSEILNSLLPPKPKNYSSGMTLDMYVGGFFGFKHEEYNTPGKLDQKIVVKKIE